MFLSSQLGDDATGDPNITTDSSGMSVVTIESSSSNSSLLWWVLAAAVGYALWSDDK
jgi:hypothetical protein